MSLGAVKCQLKWIVTIGIETTWALNSATHRLKAVDRVSGRWGAPATSRHRLEIGSMLPSGMKVGGHRQLTSHNTTWTWIWDSVVGKIPANSTYHCSWCLHFFPILYSMHCALWILWSSRLPVNRVDNYLMLRPMNFIAGTCFLWRVHKGTFAYDGMQDWSVIHEAERRDCHKVFQK